MDVAFLAFTGSLALLGFLSIGGIVLFRSGTHRRTEKEEEVQPDVPEAFRGLVEKIAERMRWMKRNEDSNTQLAVKLWARLGNLARHAPRSAIIKGWRELEAATVHCISATICNGEPLDHDTRLRVTVLLQEFGIFDLVQAELYCELEQMRDAALILNNGRVHPRAATVFIKGAILLMEDLHDFEQTIQGLAEQPAA